MYRWFKIPKKYRPEIISDISNDKFYTFKVQDYYDKKIKRKDLTAPSRPADRAAPLATAMAAAAVAAGAARSAAAVAAWEGHYLYEGAFKNIIDKNIPCTLMHKVKNNWAPSIDTVVCFMTGDTLDVFLVHPDDLTEWDTDEEV